MQSPSIEPAEQALRRFYDDVAAAELQPLWTQTRELMPGEPRPSARPWRWRWQEVRALCARAGDLVPVGRGGERRAMALANPGLAGAPFATPTLWGAFQFLGPRESAPAHRHTPAAIRFVVEGESAWTTVDGDACDMTPGDLVLTPAWCWHDHTNGGDTSMIWFDGLDMPSVIALDAVFFEAHPDEAQAIRRHDRPESGRHEEPSPHGEGQAGTTSSRLVYRWKETDALLSARLAAGDEPEATVRYTNPSTGEPVLPTLGCAMTRLRPERRTQPVRRVGSSVHVVFRGRGRSIVGGVAFDWETGDAFVVPSWAAVQHEADESSDLFSIDDRPLLEKLSLFREEPLREPLSVHARL